MPGRYMYTCRATPAKHDTPQVTDASTFFSESLLVVFSELSPARVSFLSLFHRSVRIPSAENQNEYEGLSNCRSTVKVRNKAAPLHLVYSFAPSDADAHKREKATRISVAQLHAFQAPTSVLCASGLFLFLFFCFNLPGNR